MDSYRLDAHFLTSLDHLMEKTHNSTVTLILHYTGQCQKEHLNDIVHGGKAQLTKLGGKAAKFVTQVIILQGCPIMPSGVFITITSI